MKCHRWKCTSLLFCFYLLFFEMTAAWNTDEMELFDLVEEVNGNFYEILGVDQSTPVADIKRAYRRLSVKFHPDKNKEEGAEEKFRQIVAIYEVLKDEEKRKQYDNVLEFGLPDWKMPVYYYRKVRKLGLLEMAALLLVILTVGHFLVVWSMYLERKFEMQEVFDSRKKREKRGKKKSEKERKENEKYEAFQEELDSLPRPKFSDLLPFQIVRGLVWTVVSFPSFIVSLKEILTKKRESPEEIDDEEEEYEQMLQRKRQRIEVPDLDFKPELAEMAAPVSYTEHNQIITEQQKESEKVVDRKLEKSGKEWTDEEIALLAKAVARFPAGVPGRWEKIADSVGRTVTEVTKMSKQLKTSYAMSVDPSAQGITGFGVENVPLKKGNRPDNSIISERLDFGNPSMEDVKTAKKKAKVQNATKPATVTDTSGEQKGDGDGPRSVLSKDTTEKKLKVEISKADGDSLVWSQNQQKILEWALTQYPKGTTERWEKIAEHIPGKAKEDCVARFKYLADIVRKRKAASTVEASAS